MTRVRRLLWAAALLLGLGASNLVCQRVAERGRFVGDFSSYGSGPRGTRALYLLAERLGAAPARWSEDLARLPEGGGMLVALGGCESGMARELTRYEAQELSDWIASGGVLLVAGARHYLPEQLGIGFEPEARCGPGWRFMAADPDDESADDESADDVESEDEVAEETGADAPIDELTGELVWSSPADDPLSGLEAFPMRRPGHLWLSDDADSRTIASAQDAEDMPLSPVQRITGVVVRHHQGHVIALASGSMFQNRALSTADGGALFARLLDTYAPSGPVLFDEYHLGVGERRSLMRYLRQMGATPFALQLALFALLLLWRGGARFGAPRGRPTPPPPGTASYVAGLGYLFERAKDPAGAAELLARHALVRVARHHHLEPAPARRLAQLLEERGDAGAAAAVRDIHGAAHSVGQRRLHEVVNRIDRALAAALS